MDPDDDLQILADRRQRPPTSKAKRHETDQRINERRHNPHVDLALRLHGFAIVPEPVTDPRKMGHTGATDAPDSQVERLSFEDVDEHDRLQDILDFQHRRTSRLRLGLLLGGSAAAVVLVLLLLLPAVKTHMSRLRPAAPPAAEQMRESPTVARAPSVAEAPSSREASAVPPTVGPTDQDLQRPQEASTPPNSEPERSRDTIQPSQPPPPRRLEAERRRELRTPARLPSGPIANAPAVASVPSPGAAEPKVAAPRFAGLPQLEVTRTPAPGGQGESYAVRVTDTAGRPIAGAEVALLVRLEDGTALDIPLGAGPEPGTYRGTRPSDRTAPVDVRIRVVTSDKRVEIPVRP